MFQAGFSQVEITPPAGTKKGGWMADLEARKFLDPLYARVACFVGSNEKKAAVVQLDLLSLSNRNVQRCRNLLARRFHISGDQIMICATHNHAGPAAARLAPVDCQEEYVKTLLERIAAAFALAQSQLQAAELGLGVSREYEVGFNRRTLLRNGTVRTQAMHSQNPDALCQEGPADPEFALLLCRDLQGKPLGCLANFACHPTHHGGSDEISAGFPGVLAHLAATQSGIPVCLFINGAYGNIITVDFVRGISLSKEEAGTRLHAALERARLNIEWHSDVPVESLNQRLSLKLRSISDAEYHGKVPGAQRFRSDELYEQEIDHILMKEKKQPSQVIKLQVLRLGPACFAAVPGEYFNEYQLRIKMACYPRRVFVAGGSNGMLGYIPTREAFQHGGYETTLGPPSRMAPETGDKIAAALIGMMKKIY